jgi:hypothetical protein
MGRFKKGPPEVAPHVVFQKMAEVGHKYGYYLQYGVKLAYYIDGEEYISTVKRPKPYEELRDDGKT